MGTIDAFIRRTRTYAPVALRGRWNPGTCPIGHGGTVPRGALVVREWTADVAGFIHEHSGLATTVHDIRDRRLGIDGDHRDILVTRKPVRA